MDNRVFNVNGEGLQTLKLALILLLGENTKIPHFSQSKEKGLVLHYYENKGVSKPFLNMLGEPEALNIDQLAETLLKWTKSDFALKEVEAGEWDGDQADDDIDTELGWRLYVEDWGHIKESYGGTDHSAVAALKPAYLWYGK